MGNNSGDFEDRDITCAICGNDFTFTAKDQRFFANKGFSDPKRCPDCRKRENEKQQSNKEVIEQNKNFSFDNFCKTLFNMLSQYGSFNEEDAKVSFVNGEKKTVFQVNLTNNNLAKILLYNSGEIANFIRDYVKSVGRMNGYFFNLDIKKPENAPASSKKD